MVKLSTKSRYGTRLVLDLARHYGEGPIQLSDIAARQQVSLKYLEQIVIPLKRAGLVESIRGSRGGHLLKVAPHEITVAQIVSLFEGDLWLTECVRNPESCYRSPSCVTRKVWKKASEAALGTLEDYTFQDLLQMEDELAEERREAPIGREASPLLPRSATKCGSVC
ncbi:transcriptional regulator, BadM/Rrf2 family [Desulfacinum hydrothermale DSM 13146]|uniref:Transcriptional regulator, BadM/Rrf2 family n=1 Tax=Desulfacinum hydrothermale DSM 13146 TaxID=1121390 RepID=A0A1W1XP08_9BACT|nr:Rrf2 family transcriptional regulator [Desulfacinum hydrothermale]SMC25626.1 transcriptional regulator, BadM/Rrf2 family [Desulfacinum hydrothermale DSM 13146]